MFKRISSALLLSCLSTISLANQNQTIYFHVTFPTVLNEQTEHFELNDNNKDLILSNFVAGALYTRLIKERFPNLKFNREYIMGSVFAQLLQENLETSAYQSSTDWINPDPVIRNMLLMPGQGGPYQLNDYSKRLEDKIGLINFTVLQKSLGYTIQDQDSGAQTRKNGPDNLDNKYFGPIAAVYFHFNDILRLQAINQDPWGPVANYYGDCIQNLENTPSNFFDMIMNATYNAGPWAEITKTYFELCANYNKPEYAEKIKHINDYTLNDQNYQKAIGTKESQGSTFILYPRQIRFYLDQLYNNPTGLGNQNQLVVSALDMKIIFARSMGTLAYLNQSDEYVSIDTNSCNSAFDEALADMSISEAQVLDLSNKLDREKIFNLLEIALQHLSLNLHITFSDVTENNYHVKF